MVKLSNGHGFLDDCGDRSNYTADPGGVGGAMTATTLAVDNSDYFKLTGTCNDANDEYVYFEYDFTPNVSSDVYTKFRVRWKTSDSTGAGARVQLVFDDATTQWLIDSTLPETGASFSTTFTITSGTVTPSKIVDKVRFFLRDYPNTVNSGTYNAWFDYLLLYKGDFTLPNTAGGMKFDPPPREAILDIFGRDTDITQQGGTKNVVVTIGCDLDGGGLIDGTAYSQTDWKRPQDVTVKTDDIDAQVFWDIFHNRSSEPWQWFNSEEGRQFKVTVKHQERYEPRGEATTHVLDLTLTEYSLGSKADESYTERWGIGL